jgi:hypothetical protein
MPYPEKDNVLPEPVYIIYTSRLWWISYVHFMVENFPE